MAVVFISPKQRQKVFFMGITAVFLLVLIIIAFSVFLSQPNPGAAQLVFNKPKVNIDFSIFNEDQFKNLEPFEEMQTEFSYAAQTKDGKTINGFISSDSIDDATKTLQAMGLTVDNIEQEQLGRDNPFTPYYQPAPAQTSNVKSNITAK